jgi:hypothetical protein
LHPGIPRSAGRGDLLWCVLEKILVEMLRGLGELGEESELRKQCNTTPIIGSSCAASRRRGPLADHLSAQLQKDLSV